VCDELRVLLLADTHIGFDLPVRPRVERRRRGHDFIANYHAAVEPALTGKADLVVHGGDVFDRPRVHASIAYRAAAPLRRAADLGVPVFVVPGNHERARVPHARFFSHPRIHVLDQPRTFTVHVRGMRVTLSGFPYERRDVRTSFPALLHRTAWWRERADLRLLCIHHCAEGATVGPADFMFTTAPDVVRLRDIPGEFAAVLAGHIHRHQILSRDLSGRPLPVPVLYPGSIERTSIAEIDEPKGFLMLRIGAERDGPRVRWKFHHLPARPMVRQEVGAGTPTALAASLRAIVAAAPADAVVSVRVSGALSPAHLSVLSAAHLRSFVPQTMNVEVRTAADSRAKKTFARTTRPAATPSQLTFGGLD
jgi:DNA repair exonuclease SbcCD nuclease subunit